MKLVKLSLALGSALCLTLSTLTVQAQELSKEQIAPAVAPTAITHNTTVVNKEELPLKGVKLTVAFSVAPPFSALRNDDLTTPSGIDVELVKELQRRTGFSLTGKGFDMMTLGEMMEQGQDGNIDIMGGGLTFNATRQELFDLVEPYVYNSLCIVSRAGNEVSSFDELSGRVLATVNGSNSSKFALKQNPAILVNGKTSSFMTFFAVAREQADATVLDEIIAQEYMKTLPERGLKISAIVPNTRSGLTLMFKKNSPHNKILMATFEEMRRDGTVDRILQQHITEPDTNNQTLSKISF